jgi:hypothetical protein
MRRSLATALALGVTLAAPATGLAGPAQTTSLKAIPRFSQARNGVLLARGGVGSVAVIALPDDPIGAGTEYEALQIMGVPATIVPLGANLASYPVVILAGAVDAAAIDQPTADALTSYVSGGGVLIGEAVTDPVVRDLFGISAVSESTTRTSLTLCSACDPTLADVTTATEREIDLDDAQGGGGVGTVGYTPTSDTAVLGTFDDKTAALIAHPVGDGVAYAVGARMLDLIARHWEGARLSSNRTYANTVEADADAWLLWLRGVWRSSVASGVTLSTEPAGVQAEVLLTISANWGDGILQTPAYLKSIRSVVPHAGSTVFLATHDVSDWLDDGYFPSPGVFGSRDGDIIDAVQQTMALGGQLGSESVSHSPSFDKLPLGKGDETWQTYQPFVADRTATKGATLLGELLVSRGLLRQLQPDVSTFRAPYLLTSPALAPAEDTVGYRFDSSTTQGLVQTAFPFHPPKLDDSGFSDVFSFPITVEDDSGSPLVGRIGGAVTDAVAAISNGAPANILLTPRADGSWREAATKLFAVLENQYGAGLSVDSIASYGAFWAQRDQLAMTAIPTGSSGVCGGKPGVAVSITNRGRTIATRQALSVPDAGYTRAYLYNGRSNVAVAITAGSVTLPNINPGRSISGVLCP